MSKDDLVMLGVMVICAGTAMTLIGLGMFTGHWPPAFPVAILIGAAVATLTFRYLGGTAPTTFGLGALKLSGSAALLVGIAYFGNIELDKQIGKAKTDNDLVTSERTLRNDIKTLRAENQKLKHDASDEGLLKRIQNESPQTPFANGLRDMAENEEGIFRRTRKTRTSAIGIKSSSYQACRNLGLEGRRIRVLALQPETDTPFTLNLDSGGLIDPQFCQDEAQNGFKLQISCDAGLKLFPQDIQYCDANNQPKWKTKNSLKEVFIRPLLDQ